MSYEGHTVKRQRLSEDHSSTQEEYRDGRKYREPEKPNKVLLFSILNAVYPITTEVLHTISNPCGEVQRIVIFRKRGIQAMVEFDSIQSAQRAKASLNGADIYSGCCTLKIDWAKPETLNVYKNDDETWDYTTPAEPVAAPPQAPLLGDAPAGYVPTNTARYGRPMAGAPPHMAGRIGVQPRAHTVAGNGMQPVRQPRVIPQPQTVYDPAYGGAVQQDEYAAYHHPQQPAHHQQQPAAHHHEPPMVGANGGVAFSQSPVLMLYGLSPSKMNCQKVFNILCLFGNVMKVKFLKSKPGTAMAQLGDAHSVDRAIAGLSGMKLFDEKLGLTPSKKLYLTDTMGAKVDLDDGTPSIEDFSGSRNNRFMTTKQAEKNREQFPSKVVHFYNAPIDFDLDKVNQFCEEMSVEPPVKFHKFKGKSDRSSSGLMEFESKTQALECLSTVNHYEIENPGGRFPFILKLCFSSANSINSTRE